MKQVAAMAERAFYAAATPCAVGSVIGGLPKDITDPAEVLGLYATAISTSLDATILLSTVAYSAGREIIRRQWGGAAVGAMGSTLSTGFAAGAVTLASAHMNGVDVLEDIADAADIENAQSLGEAAQILMSDFGNVTDGYSELKSVVLKEAAQAFSHNDNLASNAQLSLLIGVAVLGAGVFSTSVVKKKMLPAPAPSAG